MTQFISFKAAANRALIFLLFPIFLVFSSFSIAQYDIEQYSVARMWNEALLDAIRSDFARPTVHARNLFHTSTVMYDAWAIYDPVAEPYLLGSPDCQFTGTPPVTKDFEAARNEAISYAAFRFLSHRFTNSPGVLESLTFFESLMEHLGYDPRVYYPNPAMLITANPQFGQIDYSESPAALGSYIADCMIQRGFIDGSNEQNNYINTFYESVNPPLNPLMAGNPTLVNPTRWQPLELERFIDQSGIGIDSGAPPFLGAEWGQVAPFALNPNDLKLFERDGETYPVYHDPGVPPYLTANGTGELIEEYLWNFALVSAWSSHLDPNDGVMIDISPASVGNLTIDDLPKNVQDYRRFYNFRDGGDISQGHPVNPATGLAYEPNMVLRGDYTRVLAEFWADGPDSETPPGHWFTVLNYVSDHDLLEKRFTGTGPILDDLEWDIKAYFALGGAMHDSAVAAWSIKGWYDYIRPISALRAMADRGQSSDPTRANYSPTGIPLVEGLIELIEVGDPLAATDFQNIGKIKLRAWRGPGFIRSPILDTAGVDWILADYWWPYQRPTFVTPPFAGYISGHSTFSRAAAEVLTLLTGDPYFPGGMGEFLAPRGDFLVFEEGPTTDVVLQWATYRDASDQTSLSRIWGGIHPPIDDIPGRLIGEKIGIEAFAFASRYFSPQ